MLLLLSLEKVVGDKKVLFQIAEGTLAETLTVQDTHIQLVVISCDSLGVLMLSNSREFWKLEIWNTNSFHSEVHQTS